MTKLQYYNGGGTIQSVNNSGWNRYSSSSAKPRTTTTTITSSQLLMTKKNINGRSINGNINNNINKKWIRSSCNNSDNNARVLEDSSKEVLKRNLIPAVEKQKNSIITNKNSNNKVFNNNNKGNSIDRQKFTWNRNNNNSSSHLSEKKSSSELVQTDNKKSLTTSNNNNNNNNNNKLAIVAERSSSKITNHGPSATTNTTVVGPILKGPPPKHSWKRKKPNDGIADNGNGDVMEKLNTNNNNNNNICVKQNVYETKKTKSWVRNNGLGDVEKNYQQQPQVKVGNIRKRSNYYHTSHQNNSGPNVAKRIKLIPNTNTSEQLKLYQREKKQEDDNRTNNEQDVEDNGTCNDKEGKGKNNTASDTNDVILTDYAYRSIGRKKLVIDNKQQKDKKQQPICTTFLRGIVCTNIHCKKRHDISKEYTMPICIYFQRGAMCNKGNDCPFRHVKVNPRATICPSFQLLGYCEDIDCPLIHQRNSNNINNNNLKKG